MLDNPRFAGLDDITALVDLMADFYAESEYSLPRAIAAQAFSTLLADPRLGRVLILGVDGTPVGYVVVTFGFSMEYGGLRGFVDDFFVKPEARDQGVGSAALQAVRDICADLGVRALLVETDPESDSARRLYERAGFADTGRLLFSQALASAVHEGSTSQETVQPTPSNTAR